MSLPLTAAASAGLGSPSASLASPSGVLPVTSQLREPSFVREGSGAVKQAYATAQGFEEMLLQQLSQSLTQSSGLGGEGEGAEAGGEGGGEEGAGSGEAGGGVLGSLLPQTLSEGVMREGGLGLATQLVGALDPSIGEAGAAHGTEAGRGAGAGGGGDVDFGGVRAGARPRTHAPAHTPANETPANVGPANETPANVGPANEAPANVGRANEAPANAANETATNGGSAA